MTATNFTAATRFPWFETAKKVPTSNTIGNIYEIIPNKPKKKRLTVPPIITSKGSGNQLRRPLFAKDIGPNA